MSKKVLIISSTPRKGGNSDILCDQFKKGAIEAGNEVEKISLREKNINCCISCYGCSVNNGKCVQDDDMAEILDKLVEVDVIVLATPVYFYTMCAQLKIVIDRTIARYSEIRNKEFYFIVTAADGNIDKLEKTVDGLRGFTDCLSGAIEKGVIYGANAWKEGEIKNTKAMEEAYVMGKSIK